MSESNGTQPGTDTQPQADECVNCATTGEKILAGLSILFGLLVLVMAVDMLTGGRVSGTVLPAKQPASE